MIVISIISFFNAFMKLPLKAFRGIVHHDTRRARLINPFVVILWYIFSNMNPNYDMHPPRLSHHSIYYYYYMHVSFSEAVTVSAFAYVSISEVSMRCVSPSWSQVTLFLWWRINKIQWYLRLLFTLVASAQTMHLIKHVFKIFLALEQCTVWPLGLYDE